MNTTLALRIASVISLLFTAGHTLGGSTGWSPMGDNEVLRAMKTFRFEAMGATRTYYDFYIGFGYSISVAMLLQTVLLWQLATLARMPGLRLRPLIAAFILSAVATGVLAWRFIFLVPALFSLALVGCLALAFAGAR